MDTSRNDLIQRNIIHEFDPALVVENLTGCYGHVTSLFYRRLMRDLHGEAVLDAGCGFGLFSKLCRDREITVHSIDIDENSLAIARAVYGLSCRYESVYRTSLPESSIDTIVSNDAICHFEIDKFLQEAHRLGTKRIIVHDSNVLNSLLLTYRRLTGHEEYHTYSPFELVKLFEQAHFVCVKLCFVNFLSLPISGGFQRKPLPLISRFPVIIYRLDCLAEKIFSILRVQQRLAFRFFAVFDKAPS